MKIPTTKNYALITGATSGIGYELAKQCAADGYNLILVARAQSRLDQVANELRSAYSVQVETIEKDLFVPGAAKEVYEYTKQQGYIVDALINNAGQGQWGQYSQTELDRQIDIVHLNIIALISLTRYYLDDMLQRGQGRILNLASSLAKTPTPLMAVYAATKAFVLSFSEALVEELKETEITVTALQPWASDTDFFHKAEAQNSDIYKTGSLSDPADVAKEGYEGMQKGSMIVMPGAMNKVIGGMNTVTPDAMITANLHKMMKPNYDANGRTEITHSASVKEREHINAKNGKNNGDVQKHAGHVHEDKV